MTTLDTLKRVTRLHCLGSFRAFAPAALTLVHIVTIIQSFDQVVRERGVARTVRGDGDVNVVPELPHDPLIPYKV